MACPLAAERVWVEKSRYHDAEREYYERLAKLLKGTVTVSNTEKVVEESSSSSLPTATVTAAAAVSVSPEKPKAKKNKKTTRKSQSPEVMSETTTEIVVVAKPTTVVNKPKKQKKPKVVESEASSSNSLSKDLSPTSMSKEALPVASEVVEETKTKKKKKKKTTNKDVVAVAAEKQQTEEQENIPPNQTLIETKTEFQDSNKKSNKNLKHKGPASNQCTLVSEIAKARQHIKNSLEKMDGIATLAATPASPDIVDRLAAVEKDNAELRQLIEVLKKLCLVSQSRVESLEQKLTSLSVTCGEPTPTKAAAPAAPANKNKDDDDDGVDLFASDSDEDDAEAAKIREERLAAYAAKKSKKPVLIAKSSLVLDVKPWDDETDMKALEAEVRKITSDGLLWGASKFAPVAFGITKLSISCVVEDDKVSIDWLTEEIEKLEDYVQSVDVAAFNKI
ncbi:probable elongation factor 1-delta [Episyrphus balteatus]|uniref:probable elongation factor 1-delta n=1 Tax=Episyrphus balteatus TaxID=286459 RepID=UPI0024858F7A|nr:probable elongation factor 1-delta [Episyrphus balteatus]XP_055841720.1 probable elongation factor 1-delta [Episyrphus balteatus]